MLYNFKKTYLYIELSRIISSQVFYFITYLSNPNQLSQLKQTFSGFDLLRFKRHLLFKSFFNSLNSQLFIGLKNVQLIFAVPSSFQSFENLNLKLFNSDYVLMCAYKNRLFVPSMFLDVLRMNSVSFPNTVRFRTGLFSYHFFVF